MTCRYCADNEETGIDLSRPTYSLEEKEMLDSYGNKKSTEVREKVPADDPKANLIGSLVNGDIHLPLLDIDYPARLIPSTTTGHFHLYLDRPVKWRDYRRVMRAMSKAGLIEKGFYKHSANRGQAFLRRGPTKGQVDGQETT